MNIPAGYQLVVNSYAGDMDSYNTSSLTGLSYNKVKALKAFLDIVKDMDTYSNNFQQQVQKVQKATNYLFTEENELEGYFCQDVEAELDEYEYYGVIDLLYETVGSTENYGVLNTLENYSIYFHKEELLDLAKNFAV